VAIKKLRLSDPSSGVVQSVLQNEIAMLKMCKHSCTVEYLKSFIFDKHLWVPLIQARFSMGLVKFTEAEMATLLGQVYLKYQIVPLVIRFWPDSLENARDRKREQKKGDRQTDDSQIEQTDRQTESRTDK
jgi:hypothetical protein